MSYQVVIALEVLPSGKPVKKVINETEMILLRDGDHVSAFQAKCPHAGAPLNEGAVCDGKLICPWHKASFDSRSGRLNDPLALSDLQRYAVRILNGHVEVDVSAVAPRNELTEPGDGPVWVILGSGAAGSAAAWTLRNEGFNGRLILIDRDNKAPYDRTALTKFVPAGKMKISEVPQPLKPEFAHYAERRNDTVTHLDHRVKQLHFANGKPLTFDRLLIASGGQPVKPAFSGTDLSGVHVLRSLDQTASILQAVEETGRLVIIGNNFIGMELASALRSQDIEVEVIGRDALPFRKQFGEQIARYFRELHEQNGVRFVTGDVAGLEGEAGQVTSVRLNSGKNIPASVVVLATGVTPVCGFIHDLPLQDDGSLLTDEYLQVAPDIWAVGDCATYPTAQGNQRIEHWRVAQQQGRTAAKNMLGQQQVFDRVPFFWTAQFGTRYEYLGRSNAWDEFKLIGSLQNKDFVALYGHKGRLEALASCGRYTLTAGMVEQMQHPMSMEEAQARILAG